MILFIMMIIMMIIIMIRHAWPPQVFKYYGSFWRSTITMFEVLAPGTGGDERTSELIT